MLIVSVKLPQLISTVPLLCTLVTVNGLLYMCSSLAGCDVHLSQGQLKLYHLVNSVLQCKICFLSYWRLPVTFAILDECWSNLSRLHDKKIISWLKAKWQSKCLTVGLMVGCKSHATVSSAYCLSANQSDPEKVMVRNLFPMLRRTRLITPLLLGYWFYSITVQ